MSSSPETTSVGRIFGLILILVLIVIMAPAVSYLGVVFGWTNPSEAPPGGSGILTAYNGKVGINAPTPSTTLTVGGTISAPIVIDLDAPIASSSAANKEYVDAAAGGSGSLLTLFDVQMTPDPQAGAGYFARQGGTINAGCRGIYGNYQGQACTPNIVVPAGGSINCPTDWTEVSAGYGPMNSMFVWYGAANGDASGDGSDGEQNDVDVPDTAVIGTDSICSKAALALMNDTSYMQNIAPIGAPNVYIRTAMLSACTPQGCNVCKICMKD